jgi:hypothetical protein
MLARFSQPLNVWGEQLNSDGTLTAFAVSEGIGVRDVQALAAHIVASGATVRSLEAVAPQSTATLSDGAIAGIVVGVIAFIVLCVVGLGLLLRHRMQPPETTPAAPQAEAAPSLAPQPGSNDLL